MTIYKTDLYYNLTLINTFYFTSIQEMVDYLDKHFSQPVKWASSFNKGISGDNSINMIKVKAMYLDGIFYLPISVIGSVDKPKSFIINKEEIKW